MKIKSIVLTIALLAVLSAVVSADDPVEATRRCRTALDAAVAARGNA